MIGGFVALKACTMEPADSSRSPMLIRLMAGTKFSGGIVKTVAADVSTPLCPTNVFTDKSPFTTTDGATPDQVPEAITKGTAQGLSPFTGAKAVMPLEARSLASWPRPRMIGGLA